MQPSLPKSIYAETARPLAPVPPLEGDIRSSVVIVGGGYTGLSTALHLARRGIDAVVLEAHEPGWGASGRNGGQVNPGNYPDPDQVIAQFGTELGTRMLQFSGAAPDKVFALVKSLGIDCEAAQTGTLRVAFNAKKLAATRSTFAQLQRTGSPALRLTKKGTEWRIETPKGSVTAGRLVLATNAYTDDLWSGLRQSVVPVYTTIVATAPLSGNLAKSVMPSGSVLYEVANNTVYYRLDAQNRMLMGGRSLQRDVTRFDEAQGLMDYTRRLWPQLADVAFTHVWNGQVAITTDHHIHMHEPAENVHICLGYNGRGIAMATAMGGVLADRIAGARIEDLPMPVTGITPISFHQFHKLGVGIRLAYGKIRDRLGL